MSHGTAKTKEEDEIPPPQRPPSPPPHLSFAARGIHPPTFSAFKPRDIRITSSKGMEHIAWNCDGRRLGAVGIDKLVRVWTPEKSMDFRAATIFSGGHTEEVDYISWNPTHPDLFCSSSQKDKRIVFWDARQSRYVQQVSLKYTTPSTTVYSPDGKTLLYTTPVRHVWVLKHNKKDDGKEAWESVKSDTLIASNAQFSHNGDYIVLNNSAEHTLRVVDFPAMKVVHSTPAHVNGCVATALDPRGRYLASAGHDSIVNMFDLSEWICARTITAADHAITGLSFSHDGEFLALSTQGPYIDICATETGEPLHRVPTLGASPTVQWHPSKYVMAYCGPLTPSGTAWISLFGPGMSIY